MRARTPDEDWEVIPHLPGRWIDFSDLKHIVIREADGTLVATDLFITEEDAEMLKQKFAEELALELKRAGK